MNSSVARDAVFQVWSEVLVRQLLQALVQTLVADQNFFAYRSTDTKYFEDLPDGAAVASFVRMRDACGDAAVTVACVFKATHRGDCQLWLEVRRGFFTLQEPEHSADRLVTRELWASAPGQVLSPAQGLALAAGFGTSADELAEWANCRALGEQLTGVLAP